MTEMQQIKRSRPARAILAALLGTTILAGGFAAGHGWTASAAENATPPQEAAPITSPAYQAGFADLVAKVKPAVVNIATTQAAPASPMLELGPPAQYSPFGNQIRPVPPNQQRGPHGGARHALGSGFIIDPTGYIVTNNHVVDGAQTITVTLDDGTDYTAKLVGRDAKTDIALLKIDAGKALPAVAFGASGQARVGDWVIAVGNPFGLGGSVTAGIISAHGRNLDAGPYDDFLQFDAPLNPGNSGGPLFNQSGQVIGIDTAIYSPNGGSVGIGFAIPSDLVGKVVAQLRDHGSVERGWLGVQVQPLTPPLAQAVGLPNRDGALVDEVQQGSPAEAAHLKQGDVITAIDGTPVKGARAMALGVAGHHKGDTAQLTVWRDGKQETVPVTIGAQPDAQTEAANGAPADSTGATPVGMALAPLSPELRDRLGVRENQGGVVVAQIVPDSRAAQSGLRPGDVIVRIGTDAVTKPADVAGQLQAAQQAKKSAVPVLVMRGGTTYYLALQLKQA